MKSSNRVAAVVALLGVMALGITPLVFVPFVAAQAGRSRTQNPLPPPRQTPAPAQTPQEEVDDEVISIAITDGNKFTALIKTYGGP